MKHSILRFTLIVAIPLSATSCKRATSSTNQATRTEETSTPVFTSQALNPMEAASQQLKSLGKLAARAMEVWVYEQPNSQSTKLGYMRAGSTVDIRGPRAALAGCPGGWYPIAPKGFVCVGQHATLNLDDPIVKASFRRPETEAGLPYGYAVVRNQGSPFYTRMPSSQEAQGFEKDWSHHFRTLAEAEANEAQEGNYPQLSSLPSGTLPVEPAPGVLPAWATDNKDDAIPEFLSKPNSHVPNLSGLAWSGRPEFEGSSTCSFKGCIPLDASKPRKRLGISFIATYRTQDRRFLLTPDLLLMPADRVRLVRGTSFHGVELGEGPGKLQLPIVFIKKEGAKRYRFEQKRMQPGDVIPWRSALEAVKKQRRVAGVTYHELKDGTYVAGPDIVRLDPIKRMPKYGKDGERWFEINIAKQTLLAVDGQVPVFATLVSTGAGGLDPKHPYYTPPGIYRVHTKHIASTMDSNQPEAEFELRDVPYIQYFKDGYALHAAYWHDQFGQPRSHGCINLAPLDAKRLFHFTKPEVPPGWHGALKKNTGTIVWIHR